MRLFNMFAVAHFAPMSAGFTWPSTALAAKSPTRTCCCTKRWPAAIARGNLLGGGARKCGCILCWTCIVNIAKQAPCRRLKACNTKQTEQKPNHAYPTAVPSLERTCDPSATEHASRHSSLRPRPCSKQPCSPRLTTRGGSAATYQSPSQKMAT